MAKIVARFHTALRAIAGEDETQIEADNVREALEMLAKKYGQEFKESLFDARNEIDLRFYRVFLNKEVLMPEGGLQRQLHNGDVLQIYPPVVGG